MSRYDAETRRRAYLIRKARTNNATNAVQYAVANGDLTPMPCEVCDAEETEAHHDDYNKPLDVRWLCTRHHADWHKANAPIYVDELDARIAADPGLFTPRPREGSNNPAGRTRTAIDGKKRTRRISLSVSPMEGDIIDSAARMEGVPATEFAREATLTRAGVRPAKETK